jgi:hypothetical protein
VKDAAPSTNPAAADRGNGTEQGDQGSVPGLAISGAGNAKIPPFEFKVLEVCLEHACKDLESQVYCQKICLLLLMMNQTNGSIY